MASYSFLNDSKIRSDLVNYCIDIFNSLQNELKDYFTFEYKLIGSGNNKLLTVRGKDNRIDLDYNLILKKDKKKLISSPEKIRNLFVSALHQVLNDNEELKIHNSKSVITTYVGYIDDYLFYFDCAIMFEANDGSFYKIICDKKDKPTYLWGKVKDTKDFNRRYHLVKDYYTPSSIRNLYLEKKNKYNGSKKSYQCLAEAINELYQDMEK